MTTPTSDRLLKTAEACQSLNISRTGLWRIVRTGALPAVHLVPGGRTVRYRESDIIRLKAAA